ncbi:methyltransferase domain-containing protein [Chitinibacter fontanus]|uniref:Methyltransferase domain-containing protein n=1 Tax=Chitinibacter fontanus TaxID=1737446 RepID=A0A7D5Z6W1_9NEIS|nr:methyltransferase domain-containing protein [Chitinibacter fontanus]QLI81482.1 methyltransferase domain-containing protein [Chitinibacter fontanus]
MNIDFGKTAQDYRQHRVGFPEAFFARAAAVGLGLPSQRILDIGTGTGTLARGFALRGAQVNGVDPAAAMLEQARLLDQQVGVVVSYQTGRAEALPFADESCDAVSAGQCWHWFDRSKAAQEAYRVLRRGGLMAIAHFDWLPLPGNVVAATEALILQHNPRWQGAGGTGVHVTHFADLSDLSQAGFVGLESFAFDSPVVYSHEAWRGRIRASAGVAASLSPDAVAQFDHELAAILTREFSADPLHIPHRVFMVYARKY